MSGATAHTVGTGPAEGLLPLGELERRHIAHALALTAGHLARAAELLGIHRNTLRRKLQEYGLSETPADGARVSAGADVEVPMHDGAESHRDWSNLGSALADIVPILPQSDLGPSLSLVCSAA
jgi:hypothetical protein